MPEVSQNWDVVNVQDLGVDLRKLGFWTENKIIQACQSQYLKQAVRKDPFITLIIPCRFTVFREHVLATDPGGEYEAKPSRIVVGFADPVSEAKAVGLTQVDEAKRPPRSSRRCWCGSRTSTNPELTDWTPTRGARTPA